MKYIATFFLTLSLLSFSQVNAAHVQKSTQKSASPERSAVIEKALQQKQLEQAQLQYQDRFSSTDNLPVSSKLKVTPSQSILAAQNQSFSRFVQSLFSSNS
jgi:hypothetical protein